MGFCGPEGGGRGLVKVETSEAGRTLNVNVIRQGIGDDSELTGLHETRW